MSLQDELKIKSYYARLQEENSRLKSLVGELVKSHLGFVAHVHLLMAHMLGNLPFNEGEKEWLDSEIETAKELLARAEKEGL